MTRDLTDKPPIYAQAEIPNYWAVDLEGRRAITHTEPRAARYAKVDVIAAGR